MTHPSEVYIFFLRLSEGKGGNLTRLLSMMPRIQHEKSARAKFLQESKYFLLLFTCEMKFEAEVNFHGGLLFTQRKQWDKSLLFDHEKVMGFLSTSPLLRTF